ncbi:unnamed protein product [Linum trigynum]|uniref:Uncharacterized protein n=1 Tax=Linum trigynum TaxID=586398 RepID=A0AAV2FSV5_9ROSI
MCVLHKEQHTALLNHTTSSQGDRPSKSSIEDLLLRSSTFFLDNLFDPSSARQSPRAPSRAVPQAYLKIRMT